MTTDLKSINDTVRNCRIVINPLALQHNFKCVKQLVNKTDEACQIMAVIKANAYGHGMVAVAESLNRADAFGVATTGEAIALREQGCTKAITVFHGYSSVEEISMMAEQQIQPAIHHLLQIESY